MRLPNFLRPAAPLTLFLRQPDFYLRLHLYWLQMPGCCPAAGLGSAFAQRPFGRSILNLALTSLFSLRPIRSNVDRIYIPTPASTELCNLTHIPFVFPGIMCTSEYRAAMNSYLK